GNARHGSIRSPLWKGGGVAFGPKPRKYNFKVNAKIRKLAMISSLSWQKENDNIIVVDSLKLESHKTNYFSSFLNKLKIKDKVLVIVDELNENLIYSTRNLPQVTLESVSHVSVYQILNAKNLLVNQEVIKYFEEVLK
ncbi:MAG: 50S ribosomal protein L4, partial [Candidatus Phytoplasma stylosanthis]|nr:50S ribosomal protein L4 [Candidatus Phytoplasma stylosanthis]